MELDGDGDVVVTVHRLDDAAGLEKALRAKGVDADVSYDADGTDGPTTVGVGPDGEPVIGEGNPPPPPEGAITEDAGLGLERDADRRRRRGGSRQGRRGACPPVTTPAASTPRPSSTQDGADWVLRIPAGSPLMDRHVTIGTDADGGLTVLYAGDKPGSFCGVSQMQAKPRPAS